MKHVCLTTILAAAALAMPAPASSQVRTAQANAAVMGSPFTFTVPVELKSIHGDVDEARMECTVGKTSGTTGTTIGTGYAPIPLSNSGYVGNVVVHVEMDEGEDAADAQHYTCFPQFRKEGSQEWVRASNLPSAENWVKPKPNTPFTPIIMQDLP